MEVIKFENFDSVPKGWVNVKLDQQLGLRMGKYVAALDRILPSRHKYDLHEKVKFISKLNDHITNPKYSVQVKISIITILQYMKELRAYFNPSSSGFLLEDFLAAIIHAKKVGDGGISDMNEYVEGGGRHRTYQIKFYKKEDGEIKVNMSETCDFYVICLKDGSKDTDPIEIHVLDGKNPYSPTFIGRFAQYKTGYFYGRGYSLVDPPSEESYIRGEGGKRYVNITKSKLKKEDKSGKRRSILDVGNLDELIAMCSQNIMDSIKETYDKLSELHYNIDSIVSGVDKRGKPINIDLARSNADRTIGELTRSISKLGDDIIGG